jgi:hypothetical protein
MAHRPAFLRRTGTGLVCAGRAWAGMAGLVMGVVVRRAGPAGRRITATSDIASSSTSRRGRHHLQGLNGSWPPPGLLQGVGGEAADHAALIFRLGQLRSHHVGSAVRGSVLAQRLRDDRRAADVDLERLACSATRSAPPSPTAARSALACLFPLPTATSVAVIAAPFRPGPHAYVRARLWAAVRELAPPARVWQRACIFGKVRYEGAG